MYKTSREPGDPVGWHCCEVCTCSPLLVPDKGKCLQEQAPPSSALHLSPASIFIDDRSITQHIPAHLRVSA